MMIDRIELLNDYLAAKGVPKRFVRVGRRVDRAAVEADTAAILVIDPK